MSEFNAQTNFKEKIDMSQLWLMHVNRTNLASGDMMGVYDAYVRQQLRLLPLNMQSWVRAQEDSYLQEIPYLFYKQTRRGIKLGYSDNPLVWNKKHKELGLSSEPGFNVNRLEDGSIDWNDKRIYSPTLEIEERLDYEAFNLLIMAAAEKAGLSWNIEVHTYDYGDAPKKGKKKRSRLPLREMSTGKKLPIIPSGYDTKIISTIPNSEQVLIDWHGTAVVQGTGYSPVFFDQIQARTNAENGTILGVCGSPGVGKTYWCMRLGEILNRAAGRRFNPYIQIPFTQEHFLWLLSDESPLQLGDVIILDEAHFAAGARNWFKEDQKELVDLIASARNMGLIVILVALHMSMLDNVLRNFTMAFYVYVERAGVGIAYKTFTPRFNTEMLKPRIGPVTLQLPDVKKCEHNKCLHCVNLYGKNGAEICYTIRGVYERRKAEFQQLKIKASMERRKNKELENISDNDKLDKLHEFHDELSLTSHGNIENTIIQHILNREMDMEVGKTKSRELAKMYMLRFPDEEYNTNS